MIPTIRVSRGGSISTLRPRQFRLFSFIRVARRDALLSLGVADRRSGYPLELLVRAAQAGWSVVERDVAYGPRTGGTSKVSGSVRGSATAALDFWRVIS